MKQETTRFMSLHHGRTSRSNKKSSVEPWRSPSLTRKYCVAASRMYKDDAKLQLKCAQGENKARTEMQKVTVLVFFPFSLFPFMGSERQR